MEIKMKSLDKYFDALDRIKNNNPIFVPKGSRINNDSVALEAGKTRGSIKKSRKTFTSLIEEIEKAAQLQSEQEINTVTHQLEKRKSEKEHYRNLYHQSINRELMLLEKLAEIEKQVSAISAA